MINVKLCLYGGFRQLGTNEIILKMQDNACVDELRQELKQYIQQSKVKIPEQIVGISVFATDECILSDSDPVSGHLSLSVLPPVCGG